MFAKRCLLKQSQRRVFSLSHIPTYGAVPLLGSIPYLWKEQTTRYGENFFPLKDVLKSMSVLYEELKPVYTIGIPGIGSGVKSLYVRCTDPREFENVIRNEGRNPYGSTQLQWPLMFVHKQQNTTMVNMFTQGEEWRRLRMASQKALISPDAIKGYVPGVSKAAAMASKHFDQYEGSIDIFTTRSSFDMFNAVAFGKLSNCVEGVSDEDTKYCNSVVEVLSQLHPIRFSMLERFTTVLGFPTSRMKKFAELSKSLDVQNNRIIDEFLIRRERGELDEYESGSYVALNLGKQEKSETSLLTSEEFRAMTSMLLSSAVDTTSTILSWVLVFLALHPEVQSKARQELLQHTSVQGSSQDLVDILSRARKHLPYLQQVVREVHRLRPAIVCSINKTVDKDVVLGGYAVPAGTLCQIDEHSIQNDPDLVEDNLKFIPERWSPESVAARKNTPSEVLDHPLLRAPFSEGARMCPGTRVASLEVFTMISSLLRRWEFTLAPGQGINDYRDVKYFVGLTIMPRPMPKFVVKKYIG